MTNLFKTTFLAFALLTRLAQANDTAIYSLPVKGIDPLESQVNSTLVKFYGREASEFMKLLPPVHTVPPLKELVAKHSKSLVLKSTAYDLNFSCEDAKVDVKEDNTPVAYPYKTGAVCNISLYERFDDDATMDYATEGGKTAVIDQLTK